VFRPSYGIGAIILVDIGTVDFACHFESASLCGQNLVWWAELDIWGARWFSMALVEFRTAFGPL